MTEHLTHLGSGETSYRLTGRDPGLLEAFRAPSGPWFVAGLDCLEFTSLCPITGQPDYGRIFVSYIPKDLCVESKSLKLYLVSFRNEGTFGETCVQRIADDLVSLLEPHFVRVYGDFTPRGGIAIRPLALWELPSHSEAETQYGQRLFDTFDRVRSRQD